jgi:hypothetical protein
MVAFDRTKGCCSGPELNLHPHHDQFAELDAHNLENWRTAALVAICAPENREFHSIPGNAAHRQQKIVKSGL